ncbi:MAG: hypothetical protein J5934_06965 [Succinivibrio sp.]|nr:hypothetical protein [Succinivibrio sp.]
MMDLLSATIDLRQHVWLYYSILASFPLIVIFCFFGPSIYEIYLDKKAEKARKEKEAEKK